MDQVIEKLQNADNILEVTDLCKFLGKNLSDMDLFGKG